MRVFCIIGLAGLHLLFSGCVRVEVPREEYARTRLMLAKDIQGVQLQWMSDANRRYALMVRDPEAADPRWKPHPAYREVKGTGKLIAITLREPEAKSFEYRLQTLVAVGEIR